MICPSCNEERKQSDFLGKDRCYKCIYKEKTCVVKQKKAVDTRCIICGVLLELPKRKYCSDECIDESLRRHNKSYWTRKISAQKILWN
jgi:hypothetical protein